MKEVKSDKLTFWEFLKKDWVGEYLKRILFVVLLIVIFNYAYNYIRVLPVKADPYDVVTMRCLVTKDEIKVDVTEWVDEKNEREFKEFTYRFDDISKTLYISIIISNDGSGKPISSYSIENDFKGLKKVAIEGGILNIHQKTIWYDGEETIAVKPSPSPSGNKKN
ncbi:MAG: hypothetical protein E7564_03800 [Ruminococcaceae bacterium]|nr:hypothetical protein [Oscillospiraceae bacterium]